MWTIRKILAACLDPMVIVFMIFLVAFVFLIFHWQRTGLVFMAVGLLVFVVFGLPFIPNFLIGQLENQYAPAKPRSAVHYIVVLGAGMTHSPNRPMDMQLSTVSMLRLIESVRIYKSLPQAKLVISGGKTIDQYLEAKGREQIAELLSIPESDIVTLPAALNTNQEARFTAKVVGQNPFYLVTSAVHMARSMALFNKQGLNPIAAPANYIVHPGKRYWYRKVIPTSGSWVKVTIYFYEKVGLAWAWLRGYV